MANKRLGFSEEAKKELGVLTEATREIVELSCRAFIENDVKSASAVEPLEQIIDELKSRMRTSHTLRLQQGVCSIELGFVWADILTNLERVSDHCSNIAICVLESTSDALELHRSVRAFKTESAEFAPQYEAFASRYLN